MQACYIMLITPTAVGAPCAAVARPMPFLMCAREDEAAHLFVFGLGYVGLRLGAAARQLGWRVSGSVRSAERAEGVRAATGIEAHRFDLDDDYNGLDAAGLEALSGATHVLATVPPIADGDRDPLLALHGERLRPASGAALRWAGYLSTTGVYGDHSGGWVDEASETRVRRGSRADDRLRAEAEWLGLRDASEGRIASTVFRLAGIYGPGRSALDTCRRAAAARSPAVQPLAQASIATRRARAAAAAAAAAEATAASPRFVSRIHVDDICAALLASMAAPPAAAAAAPIFNLADDEPAPRGVVMAYAAALLDASAEVAAKADAGPSVTSPRARRRATEHKRVGNARMRKALLPGSLAYPTYQEGLVACLEAEAAPPPPLRGLTSAGLTNTIW